MRLPLNWSSLGYVPGDTAVAEPARRYQEVTSSLLTERYGVHPYSRHQLFYFIYGGFFLGKVAEQIEADEVKDAYGSEAVLALKWVQAKTVEFAGALRSTLKVFVPKSGLVNGVTEDEAKGWDFTVEDWESYGLVDPVREVLAELIQKGIGGIELQVPTTPAAQDLNFCMLQGARHVRHCLRNVSAMELDQTLLDDVLRTTVLTRLPDVPEVVIKWALRS